MKETIIKNVIKRDGTIEPWQVRKLANWQEWCTEGKVEWTPIFEKVTSKLKEIETTLS